MYSMITYNSIKLHTNIIYIRRNILLFININISYINICDFIMFEIITILSCDHFC